MKLFLSVLLVVGVISIIKLFRSVIARRRQSKAIVDQVRQRGRKYRVLHPTDQMLAMSGPGLPECNVPILPAPVRKGGGVDHIVEGASLLWCQTGCRAVAMPLRCYVPPGSTCEHGVTAPSI